MRPEGPKVHRFWESGTAYDMSQCDDEIVDGDVLVVSPDLEMKVGTEYSVAILIGAWPICINPGFMPDRETSFDCILPGFNIHDHLNEYCERPWVQKMHPGRSPKDYEASVKLAEEELRKLDSGLHDATKLRQNYGDYSV